MNQQTIREVSSPAGTLRYTLERKTVKNINLRIRRDGSVYVSASSRVPVQRIDAFVLEKAAFIQDAQKRMQARLQQAPAPRRYVEGEIFRIMGESLILRVQQGTPEGVTETEDQLILRVKDPEDFEAKKRQMDRYWNDRCQMVFGVVMEQVQPLLAPMGVEMPRLRIRDMTSRWGSCIPAKKVITLNKRLLSAPLGCIQYVVLHEFCHFIHPDHSSRFYALVASFMPDWKMRKKCLEEGADF